MSSQSPVLQTASPIETSIPIIQQVGLPAVEQSQNYTIYLIAVVVLLIVFFIFKSKKSKSNKREIALAGERGAGKTQLFISLCGGKQLETVPSIVNNTGILEIGRNKYTLTDFLGDNISKQKIVSQLARFHTILHVVDGADSKKLGDAALFIYRMLVNKQFQKDPCNYILFLNKQDERNFHGKEKLVKRIEDEIETIKVTRRNQPEENEGQEDYLRNERVRVDLGKQNVEVIVGSARQNKKVLLEKLEELCE